MLRRIERFADGADSFFRLVESSGRPKMNISLPSLARSLLAGESMEFYFQRTSSSADLIMLWPWLDLDLDPDVEDGLKACFVVSHEDEVVWQKSLKMVIVFRLSEASNVLAIAMSCLQLLPPQFDAARAAIRRLLLGETIAQTGDDHSNLSEKSVWCCRRMQSFHRYDCCERPTKIDDNIAVAETRRLSLPQPDPVLRISAFCYASPSIDRSSSFLELECHMSPYLLPEKHSNQFELVQQDVISELLPRVTDGFYTDEKGAPSYSYKRRIWCPQSSMYCSIAPVISQPLTMSQAYLMENSSAPSRRRKAQTTKSQSTLKSRRISS